MKVKRSSFFLALAVIIALPLLANRLLYLAGTNTTTGVMSFEGMGNALDQMRPTYSVMYFNLGNDTVWFNAKANLDFKPGDVVPVRYRENDPSDATLDTFLAVWLKTLLLGGIPLVILLIIYFTPDIVPKGAYIMLSRKTPFLSIDKQTLQPDF